ncbi:adenosine receptor A2b isoform X2 [Phymastichus coffea]|uniref:adenosine receptor A2b isoform X2 n=1 Tax=Phymastichus coffea TaxID=108790 RepID=UPI00273A8D11|nr:adenosine receptor A2b isoform X2 [Phymastichus coffea]
MAQRLYTSWRWKRKYRADEAFRQRLELAEDSPGKSCGAERGCAREWRGATVSSCQPRRTEKQCGKKMGPTRQVEIEGGGALAGELQLGYAACEALVAACAILGNGLVILVFARERRLRRRTNYYIVSLACADLLVGLFAIPFAVLASVGLPRDLNACLFTVSVLVVLCTISIFCLVAVSIDRYWAILYPMGYSRSVRTRTAIGMICTCWLAGTLVGFLPLLGWNAGRKSDGQCVFVEVMDYDYLVFLYLATIVLPALLIGAFYVNIYRVVLKQMVTLEPGYGRGQPDGHGTMLRLLGAAQKRELKATQNLSRIVLFFIVCWFPLYTINCVEAFCPRCQVSQVLLNFCIILSHLNSAGNPLLYAYHLKDFRAALKSFVQGLLFSVTLTASAAVCRPRYLVAGAPSGSNRRPGGLSVIVAAMNGNDSIDEVDDKKMNIRTLGLSSPLLVVDCASRRGAVASSGSSSGNNLSAARAGLVSGLGSKKSEVAAHDVTPGNLPLTLELETCEFQVALQLHDQNERNRPSVSRQHSTLIADE